MGSIPTTRSGLLLVLGRFLLALTFLLLLTNHQGHRAVWIDSSTAEQGAHNSLVTGSNPVRSTKFLQNDGISHESNVKQRIESSTANPSQIESE